MGKDKATERPAHWFNSSARALFCWRGVRQLMWTGVVFLVSFAALQAQNRADASGLVQQAIAAQKSGDTSAAIQLYQKVVELRPNWGPAEYNLGLLFSIEKRYAEAVELFNRALQDDPSLAGAYLFRGIDYYNLGDFRPAVSSLRHFAQVEPSDANVHFYLAGSYSAIEEYGEAAREYLRQLRITPGRPDLYYYLGHCYLAMAHQNLGTLQSSAPGKSYLSLVLGDEDAQVGKLSVAEQDIQRAIGMDPRRPEGYVDLGNFYLQKGDYAGARAQFQKAMNIRPTDCSALEGLGDAELVAGNLDAAIANYQKAEILFPDCVPQPPSKDLGLSSELLQKRIESLKAHAAAGRRPPIAFELARLEYGAGESRPGFITRVDDSRAAGKAARARECPAAAPPEKGTHSPVQRELFQASCAEIHGDVEGATRALIAAGRAAPADPAASVQALRVLMRLSRDVLNTLAALSPDSYWINEMQAEWYEMRGMSAAADSAYKLAAQASGDDPNVLVEYARFKCKEFQLDDAIPILQKALNKVPYNASANSLLGYVYFSKNRFEAAVPPLTKAIKANPADEQSRIYLGESLMKLHRTPEAVAILERAPADKDGRIHYVLSRGYRELGWKEDMERALAIFAESQRREKMEKLPAY
ncbi:MAG: tetratricopeptide repeat protein [Terriglobia bacterium]